MAPLLLLLLQRATVGDIAEITQVWDEAFKDSSALDRDRFPHTPEVAAFFQASHVDDFSDPSAVFLKIVDPARDGRIAAYAKWYIPVPLETTTTTTTSTSSSPSSTTGADGAQKLTVGGFSPEELVHVKWPAGYDAELCLEVFGAFTRARRAIFGTPLRPHYYMEQVGVRPEYGGRGAARMLIEWGLERADGAGMQAFVEAHGGVVALYERFGWRTVSRYENAELDHVECFMVREPRGREEGVGGAGAGAEKGGG